MDPPKNKLIPKLIKLVVYFVIFWLIFLLGRSLWQNWMLKHSIGQLNEQIVVLEKEKENIENLILYYRSDSFKELEARKKLGLKKPGEKVVILTVSSISPTLPSSPPSANFSDELKKEQEKITTSPTSAQIPSWLLWWQYFTK